MEPYLICLDLDGTLLNSEKKIGDRTKRVIARVREEGHKVMFTTGRPYRGSKDYYFELNLDTPIVNFNGGYIHHPLDPNWGIYHEPISLSATIEVIKTSLLFHIKNIIVEVMDDIYIKNLDLELVDSFKLVDLDIIFGPIRDTLKTDPTCILIQTEKEDTLPLLHALENEHNQTIVQRTWGNPSNIIEIVGKGIHKAYGIQKVASRLNIPKERIIAFGDEDNDIEMLCYAGHGIAMGNAIEKVKDVADAVTDTNDEEGIASFLESFLLSSTKVRK